VLIRRGVLHHVAATCARSASVTSATRRRSGPHRRAGTLSIESAGEHGQETLTTMPHADRIQQMLNRLIEQDSERRAARPPAPRRRPPRNQPPPGYTAPGAPPPATRSRPGYAAPGYPQQQPANPPPPAISHQPYRPSSNSRLRSSVTAALPALPALAHSHHHPRVGPATGCRTRRRSARRPRSS